MALPEKEFFTTVELAEILAVAPKTVARMVRRGALPSHRIGRARRFRRGDVEAFLTRCRVVDRGEGAVGPIRSCWGPVVFEASPEHLVQATETGKRPMTLESSLEELSLEEIIQITKEAILELPPSLRTHEALAFRDAVERDVQSIIAKGGIPDLPDV